MSRAVNVFSYFIKTNKITPYCCTINNLRKYSTKDVGFIKSSQNTDILLQTLRSAGSTKNVLDIVSDHHKIMNNKHLLQALRTIFAIQKSGNTDISTNDLIANPNFTTLCLKLKAQCHSIDLKETIEALKVVSYLGIPSNSNITQVLLQLVRHNVNQLTLHQIIFLEYIIKQFNSTPLSDALLIAFPIVFEVNLGLKMDRENLSHLTDVLHYISRKHFSEENVMMILNAIMAHKKISLKDAMSIIWSLCDLKPQDCIVPLLHRSLKILTNNAESIKFCDLETTLSKIAYRTNVFQPFYYNEEFFNMVAEITVDRDLGFQQALYIQQKFNKTGHIHKGLIDYIASRFKTESLSEMSSANVYHIILSCTNSEYRPNLDWTKVQENLEINKKMNEFSIHFDWLKFATRLAVLDIFIPKFLENAFSQNLIDKLVENGTFEDCKNFLILYYSIHILQEDLKHLLPNSENLSKVISRFNAVNVNDFPLQGALEKAFGGRQYILSKCSTKTGLDIHHAIIMRKGGFPVSFQNLEMKSPIILEDLDYPNDSKIVAILALSLNNYCLNKSALKGINSLYIRSLEASGYSVVVVPIHKWLNFPDHEKIPYLMRAIREKNETLEQIYAGG